MKGSTIIFGGLCFAVGTAAGFVLGVELVKKKYDEEITQRHAAERAAKEEEKKQKDDNKKVEVGPETKSSQSVAPVTEKDYKQYNKIISDNEYAPEAKDITKEVEDYEAAHGNEIKIVSQDVYDPDVYPTGRRDNPQMYFFPIDHVLCTEEGEKIGEESRIYKPFFDSEWAKNDDPTNVYIVDNREEVDPVVTKIDEHYDNWYPADEDQ